MPKRTRSTPELPATSAADSSLLPSNAAAELGRRGGMKGGVIRAARMTPEERAESARRAASARWAKSGPVDLSTPIDDTVTEMPPSPFAKFPGQLFLGGTPIDCYVLDTGARVISLRATVKAVADVDSSSLADYISFEGIKPFLNSELILAETLDFHIPGTQFRGKGITAERFLEICNAYVSALQANQLRTARQRENAVRCSILLGACAKVGLIALIDEATGYQYQRAEDALQVKLRAFIAEELRAWEKTFPDELWEEFGRLTNWHGALHSRPKWWGKLVTELVYDTLDPDVARYLKENRPPAGVKWHQQLTENYGARQLVSRCFEIVGLSKTCRSMRELKERVAEHYGRGSAQLPLYLPESKRAGSGENPRA